MKGIFTTVYFGKLSRKGIYTSERKQVRLQNKGHVVWWEQTLKENIWMDVENSRQWQTAQEL